MAEKYGKKVRELMIKEMEDVFAKSSGFVLTTYDNIKASDITLFRKKVQNAGSKYFVVKKKLGGIALKNAGLDGLSAALKHKGKAGVTVIKNDPVLVAKLLMDFSKENKAFIVTGGCLEGQVFDAAKVKDLANLPSRNQLLAMVAGTLNAPITSFVSVLAAVPRSFLYVLNAIKEKHETGK
ncbi:MAG: 50S ribosomal protein L10 [Candidatus Omnitrophica bacterium]|nr:50S ribosomal protein L10 [Candidatus Omnitrophota bacterium]